MWAVVSFVRAEISSVWDDADSMWAVLSPAWAVTGIMRASAGTVWAEQVLCGI